MSTISRRVTGRSSRVRSVERHRRVHPERGGPDARDLQRADHRAEVRLGAGRPDQARSPRSRRRGRRPAARRRCSRWSPKDRRAGGVVEAERDGADRHRRRDGVDQRLGPGQRLAAAGRDHQVPERGARHRAGLSAAGVGRRLPERAQLALDLADVDGDRLAAGEVLEVGAARRRVMAVARPSRRRPASGPPPPAPSCRRRRRGGWSCRRRSRRPSAGGSARPSSSSPPPRRRG